MAQKIGIDAVVFIYLLEDNRQFGGRAERLLRAVETGEREAVFASIGIVEILTGPKITGRYDLAAQYKEYLARFPHLTIAGINEAIVDLASDLRARYRIATPDAIHIATALDFGAEQFFTNDKTLKKIKEISVELI
ncbi:MAG: PIN domain-containing protein [Patescibacteria group bacterium]